MREPDLFSWKPTAKRGWRAKEPSKASRLRALYGQAQDDGRWLGQQELIDALGHRFGATIHYIHNGEDGQEAAHYEKWTDPEDDSRVMYRPCPPEKCSCCAEREARGEKEKRLEARIAELEAEVAALRAAQ